MSENFAIDVKNLSKSFNGTTAVKDVALQVKEGEIFGFLGPNGSGKTTTIRMLCGLLTPDQGQGFCLGQDIITNSPAIKSQVGYMTQRFSLYEDLSIYENLDFVARLYQVKDRKKVVPKALEELGLSNRAKQMAGTLSGGWKQRLALSAALLHKPKLLLLDEPTAGVDPRARRDFWEHIHRLAAEEKITILVSTHYMDEAERCNRLAYISQGSILIKGTEQEIIANSKLCTWQVTGGNLHALTKQLKSILSCEQIAVFGNALHISSTEKEALDAKIKAFQHPPYQWNSINPSLEDVFIYLGNNNCFANNHHIAKPFLSEHESLKRMGEQK